MRVPTLSHRLLAAVVVCTGCTQTGGPRWTSPGGLHTDVSVGDKPVRVVSGEPGSSRQASVEPSNASDRAGSRISGRVYDEDGRPAAGVRVRLAIAGEPGGKDRATTTDRSGAFTIHDLRPGMSYTLIAEQRDADLTLSGRARADAPGTGIRITLAPPGDATAAGAIQPARARVEPISRVEDEESADGERVGGRTPALNDEDTPPAAEARADRTEQGGDGSIRASWSRRDAEARRARQKKARESAEPIEPVLSPRTAHDPPVPPLDDEGPNPLPPALEVEEPQASSRKPSAGDRLALRDHPKAGSSSEGEAQPWPEEPPRPIPDGVLPKSDHNVTDSADVIVIADPPARPAKRPARPTTPAGRVTPVPALGQTSGSGVARESAPEPMSRPTWGEVMLSRGEVPIDEGVRKASLTTLPADQALAKMADSRLINPKTGGISVGDTATSPPGRSLLERLFPAARPSVAADSIGTTCRFDPTERRVLELTLPGLDGKIVSLKDFKADMILLDFWGSWCKPCRGSIPHLIEIQTRLGPKYIQVVSIACERGPGFTEQRASAAKAAREIGVNYPVLVAAKDGTCPVQKALQVQFYPTMILLDRDGRILAREQGATETTMGRMDKAISQRLKDHNP